jgi:hypothetical protein
MINFQLSEETLGYSTSPDVSNADKRLLVNGSKNVLVDYQKKVKSRGGFTRLGSSNSALTEIRNAWTWDTNLGQHLPQRFYDDELEAYLQTVDGIEINAWTRIANGWSTTKKMRSITQNGGKAWWDDTEKIDLQLMVIGDDNIYEWGGGVAVVGSIPDGTHVTKAGTTTWAQNHFYTTRNKTLVCVRTGTEYTYTSGEDTTTLVVTDSTGLVAGDILIQKIKTTSDKPASNRINDFIYNFQNQIAYGSETDNLVYVSADDDYDDFTPSAPRLSGEGETLTLDASTRALTSIGKAFLAFAGDSSLFQLKYSELAVGTTLAETLTVEKLNIGVNQGALNQECIVPVGDTLAYLSNEVALRIIKEPTELEGINPKTFSNPIKPDFDNEDWEGSFGAWYKNILFFSAPENSRMYMLNFVEDSDGKTFRFWNPPQTLPIGPFSLINTDDGAMLHGHSNVVPETYLLFDGLSDGQYENMDVNDKVAIDARAIFAYNSFGKKGVLKNFDEYFVMGEITPNTNDLSMVLNYDFGGETQVIEKTIDGTDEDILEGEIGFNSLAQTSLADNPLGGLLDSGLVNTPTDARRFRVDFEIAKEDFYELQVGFMTNERDRFWSVIAHGGNIALSTRRNINIRK